MVVPDNKKTYFYLSDSFRNHLILTISSYCYIVKVLLCPISYQTCVVTISLSVIVLYTFLSIVRLLCNISVTDYEVPAFSVSNYL